MESAIEALIEHLSRQGEVEAVDTEAERHQANEEKDAIGDKRDEGEGRLSNEEVVEDASGSKQKKIGKASARIEKKLKRGKMTLDDFRCLCGSGKKTKNCCGRKKDGNEAHPPEQRGIEIALKTLVL